MNYFNSEALEKGFKQFSDLTTWEKCYWYLRFLIDTNRFGALGKDTKRLTKIKDNLLSTYQLTANESEEEKFNVLSSVLKQTLFENVKEASKKERSFSDLNEVLSKLMTQSKDFFVLSITIKEFLIPTNRAIENVPSSESTDFAKVYGKAILDTKKEKGLATLIRDWDTFTETISLNKERDLIVELISSIRINIEKELSKHSVAFSENDFDIVSTAVCQEYERRVGQKRKQRAGNDLESVTEFVFNYFDIKTAGQPDHFTTGLEVDNWIKDKKGWYIGISLKRTLRERWKQTYTTEVGLLDRHKIKYIVHILNNDSDLSDAKVTELGSYRHLFFMPDNSRILKQLKVHVAMSKYVFPMSNLISEIKKLID